jgi:hypothetical protein
MDKIRSANPRMAKYCVFIGWQEIRCGSRWERELRRDFLFDEWGKRLEPNWRASGTVDLHRFFE